MREIAETFGDLITETIGALFILRFITYLISENGLLTSFISNYLLNGC